MTGTRLGVAERRRRTRHGARWGLVGLMVMALLLVQGAPAWAQGTGVLEGQVANGTPGGAPVGAGLPVTLYVWREAEVLDHLEAVTDAQGRFRFEGLDTDPALTYEPEIVYQGVSYASGEGLHFSGQAEPLSAAVMVYVPTEEDAGIRLDAVHLVVEDFGQVLRVREVHLYGNAGDRTYVGRPVGAGGGGRTTVSIPLPREAVGLAFPEGEPEDRYVRSESGLVDTEPVRPGTGTSAVEFSYHLRVEGKVVRLERRFDYAVAGMNVLVALPGPAVRSDQLVPDGPVAFQGRDYEVFTGLGLDRGASVVIEFVPSAEGAEPAMAPAQGQQAAPQEQRPGLQGSLRWLGLGLALLVAAAAFIYPAVARPTAKRGSRKGAPPRTPAAQRLLGKMAALDEALEAGNVDEADYRRERDALLGQLRSEWR